MYKSGNSRTSILKHRLQSLQHFIVSVKTSCLSLVQLFFSYFKELVGKEVTVELKNDLAITGILHSVDQYLNVKLENTRVVDEAKYPHMVGGRRNLEPRTLNLEP